MNKLLLILSIIVVGNGYLSAQTIIEGYFREVNTEPIAAAKVIAGNNETETDENGFFRLKLENESGNIVLFVSKPGYETYQEEVTLKPGETLDVGTITGKVEFTGTAETAEDRIESISLLSDEIESAVDNQNISGVLTASRDVFVNAAAFTFGNARFRIRGYDSENTSVMLNGIPINELENGRVFWSAWGGLNDVTRNRQNSIGLQPTAYAFGGIGGASSIDLRASSQRKQTRFSYAISNRTYAHRPMLTYSTGMLPNGWAFSFSGSYRYADEGYIDATSYEGYSYFASISKKLGDNHLLNVVALGAPAKRGRSTAAVEEITELVDDNFYNPYWGFQDGEKRNSRIRNIHQPIFMLRHDWELPDDARVTTAMSYSFGRNGTTRLDWFNAADPRPDYYRYLPSWADFENPENPEIADALRQRIMQNPSRLQLDWDGFYEANRNNIRTIENANGSGSAVQGRFATFRIMDERYDSEEFNLNVNYENILTEHITLQTGLSIQRHTTDNFRIADDLLGGDFFVDWDQFSAIDFGGDFLDNNADVPNAIIREGDKFSYHYKGHLYRQEAWAQALFSYAKIDFFLGASYSETTFRREGIFRNGRFPNSSLGEGSRQNFKNGAFKGGLTYKINGRNYLYANAMYQTRAPFFRNAYVSPRTRQDVVPNLTSEKISSIEGGYLLQGVNVKGRVTGYLSEFKDQTRVIRFFTDVDLESEFINYVLTDIDDRHLGVEFAVQGKLTNWFELSLVAAYGEYFTTNRPTRYIFNDIDPVADLEANSATVYTQNFRKPGLPQQAYTAGLNFNPKPLYLFGKQQRIFASLNFNFFDDIYLDYSPERRTQSAVDGLDPSSDEFQAITRQEKLDNAFTMDFFGGISFSRNLYLNIGVNNLLDKTDFRTGGYEQLRFDLGTRDVNQFPPRYFYSFGRNYFISLVYRI